MFLSRRHGGRWKVSAVPVSFLVQHFDGRATFGLQPWWTKAWSGTLACAILSSKSSTANACPSGPGAAYSKTSGYPRRLRQFILAAADGITFCCAFLPWSCHCPPYSLLSESGSPRLTTWRRCLPPWLPPSYLRGCRQILIHRLSYRRHRHRRRRYRHYRHRHHHRRRHTSLQHRSSVWLQGQSNHPCTAWWVSRYLGRHPLRR